MIVHTVFFRIPGNMNYQIGIRLELEIGSVIIDKLGNKVEKIESYIDTGDIQMDITPILEKLNGRLEHLNN